MKTFKDRQRAKMKTFERKTDKKQRKNHLILETNKNEDI